MIIKPLIRRIRQFVRVDIWHLDMLSLSKQKARLVRDAKVVLNAIQHIDRNNVGLLSVSLCYFCTLAVIPLLAVCFALTGGLDLDFRLQNLLFSNFGEDNPFVAWIVRAADNILATAQSGVFGLVNALFFIWLIVWMMDRVEKVFNLVWEIPQNRTRGRSYLVDLAIILIIPFMIVIFFTGSVVYSHVLDLILPNIVGVTDRVKSFLGWVVFGAVTVFTLSAMYKYIPNTKVYYRYALKAALLSGVAFTLLQYLYLETQLMVSRLNAVYGTIAAIPLFLLWLRFGWLIIIFGVQFTRSFQIIGEQEREVRERAGGEPHEIPEELSL